MRSDDQRRCPRCGVTKPVIDFPPGGTNRFDRCSVCKNREMAAYRAGVRPGECATCGKTIDGKGVCEVCREAMRQLGDSPDALKKAAKALAWLRAER